MEKGDWAVDTIYDPALMETDNTSRTVLNSKKHGAHGQSRPSGTTTFTTASGPGTVQAARVGTRAFSKEIGFEHGLG